VDEPVRRAVGIGANRFCCYMRINPAGYFLFYFIFFSRERGDEERERGKEGKRERGRRERKRKLCPSQRNLT